MSLQILEAIADKTASIPTGIKPAINGSVQRVKQNYFEIANIRRNPTFFYREGIGYDEKDTLFQRASKFYFSVGFSNEKGGDLLDQELASWSALRKRFQNPTRFSPLDFWRSYDDITEKLARLRNAHLQAEAIEMRAALVDIQRTVQTMFRLADATPTFER